MKAWRESDPATADPGVAPLTLRHILGAPPADTWWSLHRNILWSLIGWLTSAAVVVSAGYLLWAMMFRHASEADPFLGLPRPRATSTTAPPPDEAGTGAVSPADVVKVARPEPLSVAPTVTGEEPSSTTVSVPGRPGTDGGGSNRGPGGPASPTTGVTSGSEGTTAATDDDSGGNRGRGGESSTSTSTSTPGDDDGGSGGSGSGSGGSGSGGSGSGSGSGGSGRG